MCSNNLAAVLGTRQSVVNYSVYFFISDFCQRISFTVLFCCCCQTNKSEISDSNPRVGAFLNISTKKKTRELPSPLLCFVSKNTVKVQLEQFGCQLEKNWCFSVPTVVFVNLEQHKTEQLED